MSIVQPGTEDLSDIMQLFRSCRWSMEADGIFQWNDYYPNPDVIQEDHEKGTLYVYKLDEIIVGVVTFDEEQAEEYGQLDWTYDGGRAIVIHRLAVHPRYQGQGIARKLMDFAETTAFQCGYESVRLDAYSGNERALRLYDKLGYKHRGEVNFPWRELPFHCLEKRLSKPVE
ncbi:GNAT family N-acetyltransferase [Gorillibacterium timonense]|uniref:GNAT family N-acetyltransferase n=1 Tax=Gorillibacterium timonense TaxID=1689269 RepID=UPI00071CEE61|nr:GNAT family N-acetyltransferase [Gorillibacterium timonense]